MGWLMPAGRVDCDSCSRTRWTASESRQQAIQLLRAGGWHHMEGDTLGGEHFESILCPGCAKDERKKPRAAKDIEQDTLPLDFEQGRVIVGRQGFSSR